LANDHLVQTIADLRLGDHACLIYESEADRWAVLAPFLREGLERGEQVIYVADEHGPEPVLGHLRDDGLDVKSCQARGQLVIVTGDEACAHAHPFSPEGVVAALRAQTAQALASGFQGLRVASDMTWTLERVPGPERLLEYDARLDEFLPGTKCLALCQFDRRRFDAATLLNAVRTHPIVVIGREPTTNFYYVPPAQLLSGDRPEMELRRCIGHLVDRRCADQAHDLAERVKELNCLYSISDLVRTPGYSLEAVLAQAVGLIAAAWQYPEIACARIVVKGKESKTEDFADTSWSQTSDIIVGGKVVGRVEVGYLAERPVRDEGPFLAQERRLLDAIASSVGEIIGHTQATARLAHLNAVLRAIRGVNQLITREKDRDRLLQGACDLLVGTRGYHSAWIALLDESGGLVTAVQTGLGETFRPLAERLRRGELTACARKALAQPDVLVTQDPVSDCPECPLSKTCAGRRAMTARLERGGKVYGLLSVSMSADFVADEEERGLLREVAGDLAFALRAIELEEQRKRAEEALREERNKAQKYLEVAGVMVIALDADEKVSMINRKGCEILEYQESRVVGRNWFDHFLPEGIRDEVKGVFRELMAGEIEPVEYFENPILTSAGEERIIAWHNTVLKDVDGNIVQVLCSGEDITERKRTEAALRESEQKLEAMLRSIGDHMTMIDKDFNIIWVNDTAKRLFGEDILGKKCYEAFHRRKEPCEPFACTTLKAFQDGKTHEHDTRVISEQGEILDFHCTANVALRDAEGKPTAVIEVSRDTTERRRLEEQFRQAQKMEAVGRLAGGVAHDFNNLLTAITGYSELALAGLAAGDPLRKDIEQIWAAGERATLLTRQLLAFSRRQIFEPKVLDLNAVVAGVEKMLKPVIGEDIQLLTVLHPDLGRVRADPGQVEQVIMNLAVNARDAMPQGGQLTIETANADLDQTYARNHVPIEPGPYVMLAVSDTGQGMDEQTRSRAFDPFFTTKEEGTGLGLSTVYGIVKQSGGYIWVYSEPGQGTTFKVYLPRVDAPVQTSPPHRPPGESVRGSETILLVEDEDAVRELARRVLEECGYRVVEAANGDEALLVCEREQEPIHIMITDVVMPGMSGRELADRTGSLRPDMKVLYISGYTDNAIVSRGMLKPGVLFLQKPFRPDALALKVRKALDEGSKGE